MELELSPFFEKYEEIAKSADAAFGAIEKAFGDCVKCEKGCDDCCYALFDLTLVEAIYINHHFHKKFDGEAKKRILEKADRADRKTYQIKREAHQAIEKGQKTDEVLHRVAWERVRCPLLNDDNQCDLYEHRPITCRLYGVPTAIEGQGHTCGKSAFEPGTPYPTANLDAIMSRLFELSQNIVAGLPTKFKEMSGVLVPLSMALLNVYNEEYLGIKDPAEEEKEEK